MKLIYKIFEIKNNGYREVNVLILVFSNIDIVC